MKLRVNYRALVTMLLTIVYFYFLLIGIETLLSGSYEETIVWRNEKTEAFFFNLMIIYFLFLLFLGLFNRYVISLILTNAIVLFLAMMSYFKFSFLSEFLYPWDLLLYNNVLNLLPNIYQQANLTKVVVVLIGIVVLISAIFTYILVKKPVRVIRLNWWIRLLFVGMSIVYISTFIFYRTVPQVESSLKLAGVTNLTFDQNRNYKTNGFFVTFLLNMQSAIVLPPKGYNEKNITKIVDDLQKSESASTNPPNKKPNIIVIMSESFWDPTLMDKVTFDADPMPTVRETQSGSILTPTFGGGTSNVEFEALTGFSNVFLPIGSVPYQQYIKDELPAMPSYLSGLGYKTTAIHPYPKWFWNREDVYKHFGFDQFIDIDGFKNPIYKGPFVSDEQVTKTIIEQTEMAEEPAFIYAITMQNHTGYSKDKYDEFTVNVKMQSEVDEIFNDMLRSYTQGVADADAALKELMDYYKDSDEPTIIVFFGDHLPAIGQDYRLYKLAGFVPWVAGEDNWELEDYRKTRTTPLVLWNNYGAETPELGTISPTFLGPAVFDMAGIDKPLYYSLLENFKEVMPGYTREIKIDAKNNLLLVTPDEAERAKEDYQLIQYDLLFGEQYGRSKLFEK